MDRFGARLIAVVLKNLQSSLDRRPDPIEVVTAAFAHAGAIVNAERTERSSGPAATRCTLAFDGAAGGPQYYSAEIKAAHEAIALLDTLGDDPTERHNARDAEMLRRAADGMSFRALEQRFKLTAADAEQRIKARCSRIMIGLRRTYPDLFGDDVRVVARGEKCPRDLLSPNKRWQQITSEAQQRAAQLSSTIADIKANGIESLSGIAGELNRLGIPTAAGKQWQAKQVSRVIERIEAQPLALAA
jgi:hypothetical protein